MHPGRTRVDALGEGATEWYYFRIQTAKKVNRKSISALDFAEVRSDLGGRPTEMIDRVRLRDWIENSTDVKSLNLSTSGSEDNQSTDAKILPRPYNLVKI